MGGSLWKIVILAIAVTSLGMNVAGLKCHVCGYHLNDTRPAECSEPEDCNSDTYDKFRQKFHQYAHPLEPRFGDAELSDVSADETAEADAVQKQTEKEWHLPDKNDALKDFACGNYSGPAVYETDRGPMLLQYCIAVKQGAELACKTGEPKFLPGGCLCNTDGCNGDANGSVPGGGAGNGSDTKGNPKSGAGRSSYNLNGILIGLLCIGGFHLVQHLTSASS